MKRTNMMKLFALLLALAMVLCACGGGEEEVRGTVAPVTEEPSETAASATEAPETEPPVPETTVPATEAPAGEENTMSLGRIEGGTYTNDYAGIAIELSSDWAYYTAEELQEMPDNVAEMFEDTEIGDAMNTVTQFTDMMAESVEELASINVLFQKMDMSTRLAYATLDNDAILDATLAQSDLMIDSYAQAGIMVETMEKVYVTFLGEERVALKTCATMQGVPYFTLQVFDFHRGQYSVTITFASFMEDKTESLLELCYAIE